jgi:hypothetical protein
MAKDLTPSQARFVLALCASGPLGIAPLGLSRALGVTTSTVGNLALIVEREGFCTRERYGMRIFLRPTSVALAFAATQSSEESPSVPGISVPIPMGAPKARAPRVPRRRSID